ncbi:MAG: hypothetical protein QM683_05500 [Lacrimispora sp.]
MKKSLVLIFISAVSVFLAGCGSEPAKETQKETKAAAAQATAEAASQGSVKPELVFRYGEVNSEDNIITKTGYKFAEYVKELSGGRMEVQVYPNDALGNERTSLRDMREGGANIDMYRGNTNALTGYGFKKLNLFGLPYVFNNREGMWRFWRMKTWDRHFYRKAPRSAPGWLAYSIQMRVPAIYLPPRR